MAGESWLIRLTNWLVFQINRGVGLADLEGIFESRFGSMSQEQFDLGIESAMEAIDVDTNLQTLDVDSPIQDALDGNAPPAALVLVRGEARYECKDGSVKYRTVTTDLPWTMTLGEVYVELFELAFALVAQSDLNNCEFVEVTIIEPTYWPR